MHTLLFRRYPGFCPALQRGGAGLGLLLLGLALPLAAQQQRAGARASRPGGTRGAVVLDTLTARPVLYAVGVAEGGGEIVVLGGQALTTRHRSDGATETTTGFAGRAVWLLQRRVVRWNAPMAVPATITSYAQLAHFIQQAATRAGLDRKTEQPFRLVGNSPAVWWHVATYPTAGPTDEAAPAFGAHGWFAQGAVDLIGFLHPRTRRDVPARLHLHGCPGAQPFAMHVDSLRVGPGVRLLLPALP